MEEQLSVRITWDVLVSSPHFGRRGFVLADSWAALHGGDQCDQQHSGSEHCPQKARSCFCLQYDCVGIVEILQY